MEDRVVIPTEPGVAVPHLLRTDTEHLDSPMGNLVCQAFLHAAGVAGHEVDFSVAYHRGIRSGLYAGPKGGISAGALHATGPFGEPIKVVEMPGELFEDKVLSRAFLTRNRMSFGGAFMVAREARPKGKRELVSFQVAGKDFDPSRRVSVVMDSFQAGWFRGPGVKVHSLRVNPKDAVRDLLLSRAAGKPVSLDLIRELTPASARLLPPE
jgi:2',3'-cyclic-nucleotide 2'-phosphodiesterase (5'-nucleotidase family)